MKVYVLLVKSEKLCSLGKLSKLNSGNFVFIHVFIPQTFQNVYYEEAAGRGSQGDPMFPTIEWCLK